MQYLAWRVLVGLHRSITISFMTVGHTKFSPDWCFGLFKRTFRRTAVGCLDDIVGAVVKSAEVNHAQLVAKQNGEVLVPTYNWADELQPHFKQSAFKGIKKHHHFRFDSMKPGKVYVKTYSDEPEKEHDLLTDPDWRPSATDLPQVVPPAGLSAERRHYLFEKIREFCPEHVRDLVCPNPDESARTVSDEMPEQDEDGAAGGETAVVNPTPAKKPRLLLKGSGHNKRTPKLN